MSMSTYRKVPSFVYWMRPAVWIIAVMAAVFISYMGAAAFFSSRSGEIFTVIAVGVLALRFVPMTCHTETYWDNTVLESDSPVLVGFFSERCRVCARINLTSSYMVEDVGIVHVSWREMLWDYHKFAWKYAGRIRFARIEDDTYRVRFLLNDDGSFSLSFPGEKEVYDDIRIGQNASIGGKVKVEVAEAGGLKITEKAEAPMTLLKFGAGQKVWYTLGAYPTFLMFKGGRVVDVIEGAPPKAAFEARLRKAIA